MSSEAEPFGLGDEADEDGAFRRQDSRFRGWVGADLSSGFPAESGRYHLYVSHACPWASRTVIVRRLKGLEDAISMSAVDPIRDSRGWAFTGGEYKDPVNGFSFLSQAYHQTDPSFSGRVSVPVLWDRHSGCIVSNESGDIVRMLGTAFDELAEHDLDLYPEAHRAEIDALNERIYDTVNNGVYMAGFASSQEAYNAAQGPLFETFDWLEKRLDASRYLFGDQPTEADWRLFTTLVRFDAVYYIHFKCSRRRLIDYPNLWAYTRDLYQGFGIADTVRLDEIKRHYYGTHPMLNPSGIVPEGPEIDLAGPHGRERVPARPA